MDIDLLHFSYIQVNNLPYPHGDCAEGEMLNYYDTYSLSACKQECATRHIVSVCGCKAIYMTHGKISKCQALILILYICLY